MSDPKTTGRPRTLDTGNLAPLESWLARSVDARTLAITAAELLPGGAVGENWKLDVAVDGGAKAGTHTWVLRTDAAARIGVSLDRADEYAVLRAAAMAGVRVPEPIARAEEADIIGAPFMILGFVGGTAQARRIVRDPGLATFGPDLAEELGRQLARIHTIEPPADLPFLAVPER
ncbi:MAG: phosphotransferase, partial [Hyphomicrobiaceae bacterium]